MINLLNYGMEKTESKCDCKIIYRVTINNLLTVFESFFEDVKLFFHCFGITVILVAIPFAYLTIIMLDE